MMKEMDKKQGIFICFRHDTGSMMARMIYDRLRLKKGYQCIPGVQELPAWDLHEEIKRDMSACDIFLLILSKNALARCSDPHNIMRQEIEVAKELDLAFIPVMTEDFKWPERMPEELEYIKDFNAIPYIQVFSEQFFERLYEFIKSAREESAAWNNKKTGKKKIWDSVIFKVLLLVTCIAALGFILAKAFPHRPASAPAEIANSLVLETDEVESSSPEFLYKGLDDPVHNADDAEDAESAENADTVENADDAGISDMISFAEIK